jgi:glycosyltransferase involved in cell wall biosynthesis
MKGLSWRRTVFAPRITTLSPTGRARGRAGLSYLHAPVGWSERDRRLRGHTNRWESREVARALSRRGYVVDAVDFDDPDYAPSSRYDVVLGIEGQALRLARLTGAETLLLHATGSHPDFQNAAELRRIAELEERRGVRCVPRRIASDPEGFKATLAAADACTLIGNDVTLRTYPAELRHKITCVPVTGSRIRPRTRDEIAGARGEFIWFFGSGAVHKGLDRVLEAFAAQQRFQLHVVGNVAAETDFMQAYERELTATPNIAFHGMLDPESRKFARVIHRCSFFVAPTCSEGTSPAVVTMLQLGLFPIISPQTGVTVPDGAVRWLETCSVEEIVASVADAAALDPGERIEATCAAQQDARNSYSRERFTTAIDAALERSLP